MYIQNCNRGAKKIINVISVSPKQTKISNTITLSYYVIIVYKNVKIPSHYENDWTQKNWEVEQEEKKKYGMKFVNIVKQNFVSSKETSLVSFVILMVTDNFEERKKISLKKFNI